MSTAMGNYFLTFGSCLFTAVGALEDKNPVIIGFEWYENGNQRSLSYYSGKSIQRVIVYKKK